MRPQSLDACVPPCLWLGAQVLRKICWYAVLSPSYSTPEGSSSDVATLVAGTAAYKQLSELPAYGALLSMFTTHEIVRWGLFEARFGSEMDAEPDVFDGEHGARHRAALQLRVVEHNVLVVARYYTRISTTRLAELLDLTPDKV
jgi:26S proteasome regulatory subunit N5